MKFLTYSFTVRYPVTAPGTGIDALRGLPEVAGEHVAMQVGKDNNTFEAYEKFRLLPSSLQMYHLHASLSQAEGLVNLKAYVRPSLRKVVSFGVWLALVTFLLGAMASPQRIAFIGVAVVAVLWVEARMLKRATQLWEHAVHKALWLQGIQVLS